MILVRFCRAEFSETSSRFNLSEFGLEQVLAVALAPRTFECHKQVMSYRPSKFWQLRACDHSRKKNRAG